MILGCTMNMAGDLINGVLPPGHGMIPGSGITTGAILGSMEVTGVIPGSMAMAGEVIILGTMAIGVVPGMAMAGAGEAWLMSMTIGTMAIWAA